MEKVFWGLSSEADRTLSGEMAVALLSGGLALMSGEEGEEREVGVSRSRGRRVSNRMRYKIDIALSG